MSPDSLLRSLCSGIGSFGFATLFAFSYVSAKEANDVNLHRLVFPQVVSGTAETAGVTFETLVAITNPGPGEAEITLESALIDLGIGPGPLFLSPNQTRLLRIESEALQVGAVLLSSNVQVAGSALLIKREAGSGEVFSEASVFGSPLVSKILLPVFRGSDVADDTGIAIFYKYLGGVDVRFTLYDLAGRQVATRTERTPFHPEAVVPGVDQAAFFVTQLFPGLPAEFTQGSVVIEHVFPPLLADGLGVLGLYTRGSRFWTAETSPIDDIRGYSVKVKNVENIDLTAQALAERYGFEIRSTVNDWIFIKATLEVARAISRDPSVIVVHPEAFITLSAAP